MDTPFPSLDSLFRAVIDVPKTEIHKAETELEAVARTEEGDEGALTPWRS